MKRTRLKPVSPKRAIQNRAYAKARKLFLERSNGCPVVEAGLVIGLYGSRATEVHHIEGREGELLLDESRWLAVSRSGHRFIHDNPKEARRRGWLI